MFDTTAILTGRTLALRGADRIPESVIGDNDDEIASAADALDGWQRTDMFRNAVGTGVAVAAEQVDDAVDRVATVVAGDCRSLRV